MKHHILCPVLESQAGVRVDGGGLWIQGSRPDRGQV